MRITRVAFCIFWQLIRVFRRRSVTECNRGDFVKMNSKTPADGPISFTFARHAEDGIRLCDDGKLIAAIRWRCPTRLGWLPTRWIRTIAGGLFAMAVWKMKVMFRWVVFRRTKLVTGR